ncbi:MAG: polysaccharide deacetylase family protein [Clostridia bacterium]|nr:polysaccharide deacetylase family protein [Clostridia bacterium]
MDMKYNYLRFPGGKAKAITLSYDDGSKDDVRFVETINKYGLKCTFNLVGKDIKEERQLSNDFIRENMLAKGHEVANHGYYHRAQNRVRSLEGIRDVIDCRIALEKEFGIIIRGMAYPDCALLPDVEPNTYKRIQEYLGELGIVYARNCTGDNDRFNLPDNWLNWLPSAHHNNPQIMEYIDKFLKIDVSSQYIASRTPKLFYMWGHSFEFEGRQNWDHLEKLCQRLGGHEDVWYATNIEIYDYVQAYNSLQYSADGTIVYNPTLFTVWFDIDRTLYCIKPGETINLV